MADLDSPYAALAAERGLELLPAAGVGQVTPLLVESTAGGQLAPAARGQIAEHTSGVVGHLAYKRNKTFRFNVALTEVPSSTPLVPRLFCIRQGRSTRDDEFYGFEARYSKLWTESTKLNERYTVTTGPYQDPVWMRRLFSPSFIDYLAHVEPGDFSFELAYGSLLGSVEEDEPDAAGLAALCDATAAVAARIARECEE